jgi:hypothetical protein
MVPCFLPDATPCQRPHWGYEDKEYNSKYNKL